LQAFLVATVLAAVPLTLVNQTLTIFTASISQILANSSLEKSFTAFTAVDSIVFTTSPVPTNAAKMLRVAQWVVGRVVARFPSTISG